MEKGGRKGLGRNEKKENVQFVEVTVDCELCGELFQVISDHAGFYICNACRWDIVSPHIHD
jgi:ribosomal protein L37AE/L43A